MDGREKEMLKLAGKAAMIELGEFWTPHLGKHHAHYWNPLIDDGDALRLAVRLGIPVFPSPGEDDADALASTRLAIVSAAARLGR